MARVPGRTMSETTCCPTDAPRRVLVADDDRAVREALARALELAGYEAVTVADGVQALARAGRHTFGALVIDVAMPHVDGVAVCRVLRASGDRTPVLMLTARSGLADRVASLDAGADDYLPKPFEVPELLARIRALLRRAALAPGSAREAEEPQWAEEVLRIASLRIAPAARLARWGDSELPLTRIEFDLLELLVRNEGLVLDHAVLYRRVWGSDTAMDVKNLAGYIGYLRRKLADAGAPGLIHTVRGVGYAMRRP
ncbi:response regulator transcription factor [Streptomyces sp. NPDC023723]|uniref:response regulator transcription factor n=1 Tax=Streptomyces sp. NPDC023723 TaxID=3154323 RepID=UPI0033FB9139